MILRTIALLLGFSVLLASCVADPTDRLDAPESTAEKAELYYHIFVRSFTDSNGDQNGDLRGIIDSLDYLQSIGVTGLLLTPLYPSEFYHNYFADDFYGIDEEFGDLNDYQAMISALRARDMTLIMDQEIQYVSGQHDWYRSTLNAPNALLDGYALFADQANTEPVGTLFGRTEFAVWPNQNQTIVTVDMANPKVRAYFTEYLLYWMDPNGDGDFSDGVDGFRIDHMMDDLDNAGVLTNLFDAFWIPVFDTLRAVNPQITIVAEQADWGYGEAFLGDGETDMVFGFPIWNAAAALNAEDYAAAVRRTAQVVTDDHDQFVFIENHDTDRFAGDGRNQPDILKLGAAVTLLTGWTPIIYYGQEIGMTGKKIKSKAVLAELAGSADDVHDIPVRQAFRWRPGSEAGDLATWYRADPDAYPIVDTNQPGDGVSVLEQDDDPSSVLNAYRALAALRQDNPALAVGASSVVAQVGDIVVLKRSAPSQTAYIALNFGADAGAIPWVASTQPFAHVYGQGQVTVNASGAATLEPYGVAIWVETP